MNYKSYLVENDINSIKQNIVLFYGENLGLKNDFKNKIKFNNDGADIIKYFQDEILKDDSPFLNEIFNISLFKQKKIYYIENATDKILDLIKGLELKISDQKIYFFSDLLDKKSKIRSYFEKAKNLACVPCYADNEINIRKLILSSLKDFKGLSSQNINILVDNCNLDRVKLNNEIKKIKTFFTDKIIQTDKLEILLDLKINDNFNILKDEALNGNKIRTNKLLSETIIDSEKNILYLNIINQRLNKLAEAVELSTTQNLETAISMLRPPIFWKDKSIFIDQANKWNLEKVKTILKKTYKLEIKFKSNPMLDKNVLLKKLLVDICMLANA